MKIVQIALWSILLILITLVSCEIIDTPPQDDKKDDIGLTQIQIRLTDEPIDAQEVNIDLKKVIIKGDGETEEFELTTNAGIYNLLDFQNNVDTMIANATLDMEKITEIRFVVGDSNSIMVDDIMYDLTIPSGSQSGLKLKVNLEVGSYSIVELLVDFDAEKSVKKQGNGVYKLHPVLKLRESKGDGEDFDEEDEITLSEEILTYLNDNFGSYKLEKAKVFAWCANDSIIWIELENDMEDIFVAFNLTDSYLFSGFKMDNAPDVVSNYISDNFPGGDLEVVYSIENLDTTINYYFKAEDLNGTYQLLIDEAGDLICQW